MARSAKPTKRDEALIVQPNGRSSGGALRCPLFNPPYRLPPQPGCGRAWREEGRRVGGCRRRLGRGWSGRVWSRGLHFRQRDLHFGFHPFPVQHFPVGEPIVFGAQLEPLDPAGRIGCQAGCRKVQIHQRHLRQHAQSRSHPAVVDLLHQSFDGPSAVTHRLPSDQAGAGHIQAAIARLTPHPLRVERGEDAVYESGAAPRNPRGLCGFQSPHR